MATKARKSKGGCPANEGREKDDQIVTGKCPAVRRTRQLRARLRGLERDSSADEAAVAAARAELKTHKSQGIQKAYCGNCVYNKQSASRAQSGTAA